MSEANDSICVTVHILDMLPMHIRIPYDNNEVAGAMAQAEFDDRQRFYRGLGMVLGDAMHDAYDRVLDIDQPSFTGG